MQSGGRRVREVIDLPGRPGGKLPGRGSQGNSSSAYLVNAVPLIS